MELIEFIINQIIVWFINILLELFLWISPFFGIIFEIPSFFIIIYQGSLLTLILIEVYLLLIFGLAYLFYVSFFYIFRIVSSLSEYQKIGNTTSDRIWHVVEIFLKYLVLTIPAYLTIIQLVNPPINLLTFIFLSPITISYLISLRLLANPTKKGLFRLYSGSKFSKLSNENQQIMVNQFKTNVTSFYFSLTEAAIFIFIIITAFQNFDPQKINQLFNLETIVNVFNVVNLTIFSIILLVYVVSLIIAAVYGEALLESWEPITDTNLI